MSTIDELARVAAKHITDKYHPYVPSYVFDDMVAIIRAALVAQRDDENRACEETAREYGAGFATAVEAITEGIAARRKKK